MKLKLNPTTIVTEILTIVVGILLALGANEWNNQRLENNKLNAILTMVVQELEANTTVLNAIHENNKKALAAMQGEAEETFNQFTPGLQVRDTSWQTLLSSGVIENLEIDLLQKLHAHYALIEIYKKLSYQTINTILSTQAIMTGISGENSKELQNDGVYVEGVSLIVLLEKSLLENLPQVVEALKQRTN